MGNRFNNSARYDIYRNIHRALRAFMGDTLATIGRADTLEDEDLRASLQQLRELLTLCEAHIDKETHFVHAAMESRRPGSTARIAHEHIEHADAIRELRVVLERAAASPVANRPASIQRLYLQLALFVAANFEHMHIEDIEHNAVLWAMFSDIELMALEGAIVASIEPAEAAVIFRWMLPNIGHIERVELLGGIRQNAPSEVFEGVLAIARAHLRERDWLKLTAALALSKAA